MNNRKPFLISIGSEIYNTELKIHSRFNNIINFTDNRLIFSVCNSQIGAGPTNFVIKNINLEFVNTLHISKNIIYINNLHFRLNNELIYKAFFYTAVFQKKILFNNINYIKNNIINKIKNNKSLLFLIDKKKEKYFQTELEKNFLIKFKKGIEKIINNNILEGISSIKGLGFGLTPSGDDFIIGLLASINLFEKIHNKDLNDLKNNIYSISKSKNLISNTFLYFAKQNKYYQFFKNFLSAVLNDNNELLRDATNKLLLLGNSSGIDTLIGFIIGCEALIITKVFYQQSIKE
jgi:hypothetical protein